MKEKIEALMAEVAGLSCKTEQEIEEARVRLLGKKGTITALFDEFRTVAPEPVFRTVKLSVHWADVDGESWRKGVTILDGGLRWLRG